MASNRLAKFDSEHCVQAIRRAHARGFPRGRVRNFAGNALLRAVRRNSGRLCVGARAVRNLCNFPVSRRRNGPALLVCRVVSWLRSLASTSRPVDACCTEISRHLAVGDGGLADLRALEHSGCVDDGNHDRSVGVLARLSSLDQCPGQRHIAALVSRRSGWITAGLAIMPLVFSLSAVASVSQPAAEREWQVFNLDALPGLIANGNTVLVDVTATWCLTCKVNELRVLENAEVRSRFQQSHVIRMRADWSRPNPLIANYLRRFGRYGIPFDVVYGPGRPQGEALPELLTTSALLHAIDRASVQDDNRKSAESAP